MMTPCKLEHRRLAAADAPSDQRRALAMTSRSKRRNLRTWTSPSLLGTSEVRSDRRTAAMRPMWQSSVPSCTVRVAVISDPRLGPGMVWPEWTGATYLGERSRNPDSVAVVGLNEVVQGRGLSSFVA